MSTARSRIGTVILAGTLSLASFVSAQAANHAVLYSFTGGGDGTGPAASLTHLGGLLYGTTYGGGAGSLGTVFEVSKAGAEKLVYSFEHGFDGANPAAPVLNLGGTFYGTTEYGGRSTACTGGCGTVFAVTPDGEEVMRYSFRGGKNDGANPTAGLVNIGGILYGTTAYGGKSNYGTVFAITPNGAESVLYSFTGGTDGGNPMGHLLEFGGMLYGTTYAGGANHYGTVFAMTTDGVEKPVYSFLDGNDGAYPSAGLVKIGRTLYGTSGYGAAHLGTVYSVTPTGSFKVLHSFKGGRDGAEPVGDLINLGSTLYGVSYQGGIKGCFDSLGCGTVFSVTPGGAATILYSFKGGSDGLNPDAGLTDVGGRLYGTTVSGGTDYNGTVFVITP